MKVVGVREIGKDQYTVSIEGNKVLYRKMGGNTYNITIGEQGAPICTCRGFQFHGKCRHCSDYEELAPTIAEMLTTETAPVEEEEGRINREKLEDTVDIILDRFHDEDLMIAAAGSWRRGKPTVKDLDFVTTAEAQEVFYLLGNGQITTSAAGTKVVRFTIEVDDNQEIQVDFALTTPEFFGACLMYLTGDKDFNVRMRQRAKRMGLKLSRNGLEDRSTGVVLASQEVGIFNSLGLDIIPPSCREKGRWEEFEL